MSKSLGFRGNLEFSADRPGDRVSRTRLSTALPPPSKACENRTPIMKMVCIKGFLPILLFSSLFLSSPLVLFYGDVDFTRDDVRGCIIGASAALAIVTVIANDCVAWFNFILFFHIGLEVRVLDVLMEFARASTTSDGDMALAWTGFVVILLHLVPFLFVDQKGVLILLSLAGGIVNASALVFLQPALLIGVVLSAINLLIVSLFISGICNVQCCILTSLLTCMKEGTWITCSTFDM